MKPAGITRKRITEPQVRNFIELDKSNVSKETICKVLQISKSSYHRLKDLNDLAISDFDAFWAYEGHDTLKALFKDIYNIPENTLGESGEKVAEDSNTSQKSCENDFDSLVKVIVNMAEALHEMKDNYEKSLAELAQIREILTGIDNCLK